jgi:hypothetical protein
MMVLLTLGIASHANTSEEHSVIAAELLPVSLQTSWQVNKPQLGKFGHCAAAFDSRTDDNKMAFACSIYVKLDAVAQRKAIQHCDEQRVLRNIKSACQLIK